MATATTERRELTYNSFDEAIADAEQLASGEVRTSGNHTFGQILEHLARTFEMSSGKIVGPKMPLIMRIVMPFIKGKILSSPATPGFKLSSKAQSFFWPEEDVDVQQSLTHLKEAIEYYKTNGPLEVHPVFGKATREQIDNLNITHAAMHLSFVHPA